MSASNRSLDHIFLFNEDKELVCVADQQHQQQWITKSLCVFEGKFTRNSDREKLVASVLALYAFSIVAGQNEDGSFSNDESGVGTAFATSWMASLLATLRFECLLP